MDQGFPAAIAAVKSLRQASDNTVILEHMFDKSPPEPAALRRADDAAVVTAIEEWARIEAAAGARRLDAIAELTRRRCDKEGKRAEWACDGWDSAAAEVAAALGVRHNKASSQMTLSLTLRRRLPKVAGLYADGKVTYRIVTAIAWHTDLVADGEPIALIDAALAAHAAKWGRLSDYKLSQAIDVLVDHHDPGGLRRVRSRMKDRWLDIGREHDTSEMTSVSGKLYATDAAMLKQRLMQMAQGICDDDPRTMAQRRADALGALAAGAERLACACGDPDCASAGDDGRASNIVIHVVTESVALDPEPDSPTPVGLLQRSGIVPTPLLAELIRSGARVRSVDTPVDVPEPGYLPSAKLAEFVRCRNLTCRFPECEESAEFCDIDHTIPYPVGPTHLSNLKCLCRKQHLLNTFGPARQATARRCPSRTD